MFLAPDINAARRGRSDPEVGGLYLQFSHQLRDGLEQLFTSQLFVLKKIFFSARLSL